MSEAGRHVQRLRGAEEQLGGERDAGLCEERWTRGSSPQVTAVDGRAPTEIDRQLLKA